MKKRMALSDLKDRFKIRQADLGHLPYRARLEKDEATGECFLPMPKEVYGDYAEIDDVMSFKRASKGRIRMKNLSCKQLKWSVFNRELTSICRQLGCLKHPLNRMIVEFKGQYYLITQGEH